MLRRSTPLLPVSAPSAGAPSGDAHPVASPAAASPPAQGPLAPRHLADHPTTATEEAVTHRWAPTPAPVAPVDSTPGMHLAWLASMRIKRAWAPAAHPNTSAEFQPVQPSEAGRRLHAQVVAWHPPHQDDAGPLPSLPARAGLREIQLPMRILMATDLSARCDRALARAARLAEAWHSRLTVAHAVHAAEAGGRDGETGVHPLQRMLGADLQAQGISATPRILVGPPAEAVQQAAAEEGAGLLVLGIARDAPARCIQLGGTVDALVRRARVPVLNVRGRAGGAYRHVAVATDFSRHAMQALRLAARWFAHARLTLFHAHWPPAPGLNAAEANDDGWRAAAERECAAHLAAAGLPGPAAAAVQCLVAQGAPEALLPDAIAGAGIDLVVLGAHGWGLQQGLLGSTAENLLHALDCDTLVVRDD